MPEGRTLHSQEIPLQIPQPFGGQIEQHPELGQLLIRPCRRLVHNHLLAPHPALFCAGRANCRQEAVIACSISRMGSTNAVRPGIIGRAGELVTHASLVGAAPLGYRLPLLCRRLEVPPWYLLVPDDPDSPMRIGSTVATAGAVGAWLVGDWPLPGGDPAHFQWSVGSHARYPEAQVLRQLVKSAEQPRRTLTGSWWCRPASKACKDTRQCWNSRRTGQLITPWRADGPLAEPVRNATGSRLS
jgi:hypothetical protein